MKESIYKSCLCCGSTDVELYNVNTLFTAFKPTEKKDCDSVTTIQSGSAVMLTGNDSPVEKGFILTHAYRCNDCGYVALFSRENAP